jgi:uncharacterized protein (TIGR03435 family)
MNQATAAASLILFSVLTASGQGTTDTPEFEVASVKRVATKDGAPLLHLPEHVAAEMGFAGGPGSKDPGRIDYSKVTLKMLLVRAYNLKPSQISGPGWLETEQYTIAAKLPPGTNADQLRLMLQKLLTERFQISLHREVKERPVYRLTVAKNGPKLKPPEEPPQFGNDAERSEALKKQMEQNQARMIALMAASKGRRSSTRSFGLRSATTERFAEGLSGYLDRPVKDMTQLKGKYSFKLEWALDTGQSTDSNDEPSGPSIFRAIEEQLGLKLEAEKEPIELLVIDEIEKSPTSN